MTRGIKRVIAIGDHFGFYEVIGVTSASGGQTCELRCVCGTVRTLHASELRTNRRQSCGCQWRAALSKAMRRHRRHGTPEYVAWHSMIRRCTAERSRYVARGIRVADEWTGPGGFERFFEHVGPKPSPDHSLDRFPKRNGDYEPGNVRWATQQEQSDNKDRTRKVAFNGEELTLAVWASRIGICSAGLAYRLDSGWSVERAVTTPARSHMRKAG